MTIDPEDYRNRVVSIFPHPDARLYLVRLTYADGKNPPPYQSTTSEIPIRVRPGEVKLEAWAIGDIAGPKLEQMFIVQHDENIGMPKASMLPPPVTGLASDGPVDLSAPAVVWDAEPTATTYTAELMRAGVVLDAKAGLTTEAASWTSTEITGLGGPWPGLTIGVIAVNSEGDSEPVNIRFGQPTPPTFSLDVVDYRRFSVNFTHTTPGFWKVAIKLLNQPFDPSTSQGVLVTNISTSPKTQGGYDTQINYVALAAYDPALGVVGAEWSAVKTIDLPDDPYPPEPGD